jgi:hypothetical protein
VKADDKEGSADFQRTIYVARHPTDVTLHKEFYSSVIKSGTTYGAEAWAKNEDIQRKL